MRYPLSINLSAFFIGVFSSAICCAQKVDATAAVSGLRETFSRGIDVNMRGSLAIFAKGWNLPDEAQLRNARFHIVTSDEYWRISTRGTTRFLSNGVLTTLDAGCDYLLGLKGALSCDWIDDKVQGLTFYERGKSKAVELDWNFALAHLDPVCILFGYLDGQQDHFIPDQLIGSTCRDVADSDQVVLEIDGTHGKWTVRVDPDGFLPVEIAIAMDKDDLFGKQKISDYGPSADSGQLYPNRQLTSVHRTIHFSTRTLGNGEQVIAGVTSHDRLEYSGDVVFEIRNIVSVDDIARAKQTDDEFSFARLEIPDGTPVQLDHAPQLPYVWENGTIVKGVPIDIDNRLPPFQRRGPYRVLAVLGSIVLIAISAVLHWIIRWRRKRAAV